MYVVINVITIVSCMTKSVTCHWLQYLVERSEHKLTPCVGVPQVVTEFPTSKTTKSSLLCSQQPIMFPCLESDKCSLFHPILFV